MTMNYITTTEAAKQLGISRVRVNQLCNNGQIVGAVKFGQVWAIPDNFTVLRGRGALNVKPTKGGS